MNDSVFVSICIPFYNAELTLLDAVRSVFAQTHKSWELILIDDGSTDRSLELAYSINDDRVSVYSDGDNRRLAARLNQAAKLANHEFIARMDADDLMSTTRLEKQLELLLSNPKIDLVSTGLCSLNDNNEPVGIRCVSDNHVIEPQGLLSGGSGIVHASLLGRTVWFKRNPYKESMLKSQDTNLWVRSYSKDDLSVAFISEPLYYYREDSNVTKKQLLTAYSMGRQTILHDAKDKFSFKDKTKAITDNLVKTFAVQFFTQTALKVARSRRNTSTLSNQEQRQIKSEISVIRDTHVPIAKAKGEF